MTDRVTRETALEVVTARALPLIVRRILTDRELPEALELVLRSPDEYFALTAAEQVVYGGAAIVPLWCRGLSAVVAYDRSRDGFVRFDMEQAVDARTLPCLNWQQILLHELHFLWESEVPDEELAAVAEAFGFEPVAELLADLPTRDFSTTEACARWRDEWLARLARR